MTDKITFLIVGVIYMAILYSLVKPSSKGPQILGNILGTFTDLVRGTTGQTYSNGQWSTGNG
jgi:hypothetical protein